MIPFPVRRVWPLAVPVALAACGRTPPAASSAPPRIDGAVYVVRDTIVPATLDAAGIAEPVERTTVSTKLLGTVTEVAVHAGDAVRRGQLLARIDAREISAKRLQAQAAVAEAEAVHTDALTQATRMRALYADSAATRAQLDAAETGLARAEAALRTARAAQAEVEAMAAYTELRAPFDGVVTARLVDVGALAAPGAPLVTVENSARLRITVTAPPAAVRGVRRGARVDATIEGTPTTAVVEGVVPAASGALYTVNALVDNAARTFLAGSSARLALVQGMRRAVLVPAAAIVSEGDLSGVHVVTADGPALRWVRVGPAAPGLVEVLSGLRAGERIVVPRPSAEQVS